MPLTIRALIGLALLVAGCKPTVPAASAPAAPAPTSAIRPAAANPTPKSADTQPPQPFVPAQPLTVEARPPTKLPPASQAPLEDLAHQAAAQEFNLPVIQEGKVAAAGIRKLEGKHLTLYTDLPPGNPAVEELPRVFDAAVPLWCEYFGVDPAKTADWKIVGSLMKDKERFLGAGLYDENLPPFPNGYAAGSKVWLYDQPSDYYRRHLLLHEGTHAFMNRWLGGAGPPWYMEGLAELLGTHRWEAGKLQLAYVPRTKEEAPYWGRIKVVKDEYAADRGLPLVAIMKYDHQAHLKTDAYAWSWAAVNFFDQHPQTQALFRELKSHTADRTIDFSKRFYDGLKEHWREIDEDWQLFVSECDYGYDVARAATLRKPAAELPAEGASVAIAADRGWQSTGVKLRAGQQYQLTASGRFQVAGGVKPWLSEAGGVTIRYVHGRPLGLLVAAVGDLDSPTSPLTPLATPQPIGTSGTLRPESSGTLYLRINDAAAGLADNAGNLTVRIAPHP